MKEGAADLVKDNAAGFRSGAFLSGEPKQSFPQAIGLMCLAGLVLVIMVAIIKALSGVIHPMMVIWGRFFFHMVLIMVLFPGLAIEALRVKQKPAHLSRTLIMLISTLVNTYALTLLPLANVSAISFTAPILVAFMATVILHEKVTATRILVIAFGFSGTLMIVQPSVNEPLNLGALLALATAFCYAAYQVTTRFVRETSPMVSLFYTGAGGAVVFTAILPLFWHSTPLWVWPVLMLVGILGACGHLLIILALRKAEASKISPFNYVQLVYAIIISIVIFGDLPDLLSILGTVVIVASGLILYLMDTVQARRDPPQKA